VLFVRAESGAFVIAALLFATAAPAGVLKCASHTITAPDASAAIHAARRAAGDSKIRARSLSVCLNPGRGRAWYGAEPEPQADGSVVKPSVECLRGTGPWRCEKLEQRTARFDVALRDGPARYEFALPATMDIGLARQLVTRAFEIAPTLTATQECNYRPPRDPKPGADDMSAFHRSFERRLDDPWANVDADPDGSVGVVFDFNGLTFRPAATGDGWSFECWYVVVVVS